MTVYTASFDHAAASYGHPVLLDSAGAPHGPADVGLWGTLPANYCGRVDVAGEVYWSGYGERPDRMWRALCAALSAHPDLVRVEIVDQGRVILRAE